MYLICVAIALVLNGCDTRRVSVASVDNAREKNAKHVVPPAKSNVTFTSRGETTHEPIDIFMDEPLPEVLVTNEPKPSRSCNGMKIGLYSWDQRNWVNRDSSLLQFLSGELAHSVTCGEVYVNVADYSSADSIPAADRLVPFIKSVRSAGNSAIVWMTYGDVTERNVTAVYAFINTFKRWMDSVSPGEAAAIAPVGISFDIENFPAAVFKQVLQRSQALKATSVFGENGFFVGCTIEGQYKPVDTDIIMRYADRALMMAYRNYITKPGDLSGTSNGLMRQMRFMFTEQCPKCLNDDYARANYKAKVTLMFETACKLGASCSYISFCAYDGPGKTGGIDYFLATVLKLDGLLVSSGLMTASQKSRLISTDSPYAVHHWEWFDCFFRSSKNALCRDYHSMAQTCRKS